MSFETIKIARQLPVINGMVQLPEKLPPASNPNSLSGCRGGIPLQTFMNQVNGASADAAEVTGAYGSAVVAGSIIGGVALGTAAIVQLPQGGNSGRSGGTRGKQTFVEFVDSVTQSSPAGRAAIESAKTYFNANLAADTNSSTTVNGVANGMPSNTDLGR